MIFHVDMNQWYCCGTRMRRGCFGLRQWRGGLDFARPRWGSLCGGCGGVEEVVANVTRSRLLHARISSPVSYLVVGRSINQKERVEVGLSFIMYSGYKG